MILSAEHIFYRDILQNISFQVKEKEKIGIAGLSGSGKTTLLKLLNNLLEVFGLSATPFLFLFFQNS